MEVSSTKADLAERQKALEEYQARAHQLELIKERFEKLKGKLDELTKLGLAVNVRHNRMVISLPGDVLFDSGRETLKKDGKGILLKVAGVIKADPQLVARDYQVAGHTDNEPLQRGPFKDNWGLSLMRAREVLVFLVDGKTGGQLPVDHWSATGFADTDPSRATTATMVARRTEGVSSSCHPASRRCSTSRPLPNRGTPWASERGLARPHSCCCLHHGREQGQGIDPPGDATIKVAAGDQPHPAYFQPIGRRKVPSGGSSVITMKAAEDWSRDHVPVVVPSQGPGSLVDRPCGAANASERLTQPSRFGAH